MSFAIAEVDGTVFMGHFQGFDHRLEIDAPRPSQRAANVWFDPWRYRDHMTALKDCVFVAGEHLDLDRQRFARHVMDCGNVPEDQRDALAPLALWWAAGGEAGRTQKAKHNTVDLGTARARLRPWTERERLAALLAARVEDDSGQTWFDVTGYVDTMVRISVAEITHAVDMLDSRATAVLLDTAVALNIPDIALDPILGEGPAARAMAERTLGLCRALGWTPTQVWEAPAAEIDRLWHLVALAGNLAPAPMPGPRRQTLADAPDATVFRFTDDAA
jgi:hypothetical protein